MSEVLDGVRNFQIDRAEYDGKNVSIYVKYDITYSHIYCKRAEQTEAPIDFPDTFIGFRLSDNDLDKLIDAIEKTGKIKKVK